MAAVISRLDSLAFGPTPAKACVTAKGDVQTGGAIDGDRPLLLWMHKLAPGAGLSWESPSQDHLVYVWEGRLGLDDGDLGEGEALVIEHAATTTVRALDGGVTLLHFHRPADHPVVPAKAGGHRHAIRKAQIRRAPDRHLATAEHVLWADAACPTCEVWLHGNTVPPGLVAARHFHTEDEIIVVMDGQMKLGKLGYGRGSVLAVDAETAYGFTAGEDGLTFINFRPGMPHYVVADGSRPPINERRLIEKSLEAAGV